MHRKDLSLTYFFPSSPDTVFLKSLVTTESVAWTWAQLHSWACSGAITDSVGVFSSDITSVATFSGFGALASSSGLASSASVKVHNSLAFFHTSVESNAAQIAGCCSKKRSNISQGLFHLVQVLPSWWETVGVFSAKFRLREKHFTCNNSASFSLFPSMFVLSWDVCGFCLCCHLLALLCTAP